MNLQLLETVIPVSAAVQYGCERIDAMAWGRSDDKLAVCRSDRVIYLYDEKGGLRDKFQTRAKDPSDNAESYTVTCMAFSPDSTRLAVGQSDLIVYVYKIGEEFKMKKSIIHKYQQPAPVTSIAWPKEYEIFCGLLDGKVRQCHTISRKGPKTRTIMSNESCNIALISNVWGTEMIASFTDGRIAVFEMGDEDAVSLITVIRHSCPPTAVAITNDAVLAAGYDKKLYIYDKRSGEVKQLFDYSIENDEREFACAAANPEGKSIVVGSYNKLFVYHYVARRKEWQEGNAQDFDSLYMVSSIQWRKDGSVLAVANNIGALYLMEATYKRTRHERFEMIYSSPSSIILNIFEPQKSISVKSRFACEILEAKLSKDGNFAIVKTGDTLLLCEVPTGLTSEIAWLYSDKDKERFYFEYENVCVIYYESEMTIVEYGRDETLGSFRVDTMNTHVVSIRVCKRFFGNEELISKKLAYLVDPRSITIVDLQYNLTVGNVGHDTKIDWLELNESGTKLLFRDKRSRLYLYGVDSSNKLPLVE